MCASPHTAGLARERRWCELENLGRLVQSRGTFSIFHVEEFHESHEVGSVLETRQKSRTRERMFSCVFPKKMGDACERRRREREHLELLV